MKAALMRADNAALDQIINVIGPKLFVQVLCDVLDAKLRLRREIAQHITHRLDLLSCDDAIAFNLQ
jgi:hypothetical protein